MYRITILASVFLLSSLGFAQELQSSPPDLRLSGLQKPAQIVRDIHGLAHLQAKNEHDLFFLQGYVHAQDRLFQMDVFRRQASGTLAELLGPGALPNDVELRTIGLRRAAERSLPALSDRVKSDLEAYAAGVNAYAIAHPLPPEYAALELTRFEPWTVMDSVTVGKLIAFSLSFDLDIDRTVALSTYREVGPLAGFDGTALFFQDLFRSAPFDQASTVPDASAAAAISGEGRIGPSGSVDPRVVKLGKRYLKRVDRVPLLRRLLNRDHHGGSNQWAVAGEHTDSGAPLLANDPHLQLTAPSIFYPIHLQGGMIDVIGSGFAGIPYVVVGQTRSTAWAASINPMDVTDVYQEQIVPDPLSPSGLSTVFQGRNEPIFPIPETFHQNNPTDGIPDHITTVAPMTPIGPDTFIPPATLIVPRRNNGPILDLDLTAGTGLSLQYTGFSPTRELDALRIWNEAKTLFDFVLGLQFFDFGSENFGFVDTYGNIAYFVSAEMPIREDLQAGAVAGLPPFFIRNGSGGNEWLAVQHPQPFQAVPYEILPFIEMPALINPPRGWFVNANNDPAGTTLDNDPLNQLRPGGGIFYLNPGYDSGFRAGRITQLLRQRLTAGKVSFQQMQAIQADTVMPDARFFTPLIIEAMARAREIGADPALAVYAANPVLEEAVQRLRRWDQSTPTGIPEGYDAVEIDGQLLPPLPGEGDASVAATLYSVWRGRFLANTIDTALLAPNGIPLPVALPLPDSQRSLSALRHLLESLPDNHGVGASGIDFFPVPGVTDPDDRRDILILQSLKDALTALSGDAFAPAYGRSTDLDDYRWGKLHRVVMDHPIGPPFSIPPALGFFPSPLPGLVGIPVDGGFETVDASGHDVRAADADGFIFGGNRVAGPAQRFVADASGGRIRSESSLPGGTSALPGDRFYLNLLPAWLTNDTFPLLARTRDLQHNTASVLRLAPLK